MRFAAVGHVEWMEFVEVERVPAPGEIISARATSAAPCGGAGVSAVQLARLAGEGNVAFFTALGDDELGHRSKRELERFGLTVHVAWRDAPTRRGFTYLDDAGERTITVIGERHHPRADDDLPWDELDDVDACFLTAGDAGAVRRARAARVLVATSRVLPLLQEAGIQLDAVVGSGSDPKEQYVDGALDPPPRLVVRTAGERGGAWVGLEGRRGTWTAAPLPGPRKDAFGCGDSFAAGLTYALGDGRGIDDALELAARCGAYCHTGRGPYEGQLSDPS